MRNALIVVALLLSIIAPTRTVYPSGGDVPVIDTPSFAVGDEWRWEGGPYSVFSRVVAVDGEKSVVESNIDRWCRDGCRYTRDKNLTTISGTNNKGEAVNVSSWRVLQFPLEVGKEWTQELDSRSVDGRSSPYFNKWKIEAFDEVKVKAGTFKAFRISWYQENRRAQWRGNCTMWWAPDVKNFIRRVVHTSGWGTDWELVSYTLK